jgi:hypothetical protein
VKSGAGQYFTPRPIWRSWTQAASIEETLALWAASLQEIRKRIRPLFTQERVATNAGLFLEGLLGDEQRKTGWMRAEAAGDAGPWRQQAILGRMDWDADALRDIVRDYVIEHLADDDAVLVIDETGFLKKGNPPPPKKIKPRPRQKQNITTPPLVRWSIREIRRIAIRLAGLAVVLGSASPCPWV